MKKAGFHSENDLWFNRNEDGSVTITKFKPNSNEVEFTQTVPKGIWCSVVCSVSVNGESDNRFYEAEKFHG